MHSLSKEEVLVEFSTHYPHIVECAHKTINSKIRNSRKAQVRFTNEIDDELVRFYNSIGDIKKASSILDTAYGHDFAKKCRDRFNTYLLVEPEFTPEENKIILEYHYYYKIKFADIAKTLHRRCAKKVQNQYTKLYKRFLSQNYSMNLQILPLQEEPQPIQEEPLCRPISMQAEAPVVSNENTDFQLPEEQIEEFFKGNDSLEAFDSFDSFENSENSENSP